MTAWRKSPRFVYFLRRFDGTGPVKIGCSAYPGQRARQISSDLKEKVVVICHAQGGFVEEQRLHRQLATHRLDGEWFHPAPEVLAIAAFIHDKGKLPPTSERDRNVVLAARYLGGETLEAIATDFSITRERVRQILRKQGVPSLGYRDAHKRHAAPIEPEEEEIAEKFLSGETTNSLKSAYPHRCIESVLVRTGAHGKKRESRRESLNRQVVELYERGSTADHIAAELGLAHGTYVYRILKRAGLSAHRLRRPKGWLEPHQDEIIERFLSGETAKAVAAHFGAKPNSITQFLSRHGIRLSKEEAERRRMIAVRAANARRASTRLAA